MNEGLSHEVHAFILAHVDSLELLETLLLLASHAGASFTADLVSERLRTSPSSAASRLSSLYRRSLIEQLPDGAYRFSPTSQHQEIVREVDRAYRERSVRVVSLIYSRPSEMVTVFADAFVLREPRRGKKGEGDG